MKKIIGLMALLFALTIPAMAQYASRIRPLPTLPATCNPLNGEVVTLTTGAGVSPGIYNCTATNTWRPAGFVGNGLVWNQGTLTASSPIVTNTATWNNAGVGFINYDVNITNLASQPGSLFIRFQSTGVTQFSVSRIGTVWSNAYEVNAGGKFNFSTRSEIKSSADGLFNLTNAANTNFTRLNFGPEAITHPAITVSAAVGGQTQGIIITKADGTTAAFANLGAATNGSMIYCSDCTIASPCAGGGTGAIAKRLNGAWVCN